MPRRPGVSDASLRAEMLQHAARIFAESEYHRTPTSKLAVAGRFSEGRYFTYFRNKDGILRAIYHEFWRFVFERATQQTVGISDPVERLRITLGVCVDAFVEYEHFFRVIAINCYPADTIDSGAADYHGQFKIMTLRNISEAVRRRKLSNKRGSAEFIYHAMIGALELVLNQCYRNKYLGEAKSSRLRIEDVRPRMNALLIGLFRELGEGNLYPDLEHQDGSAI